MRTLLFALLFGKALREGEGRCSSSVAMSLEVEVKLEDAPIEASFEPVALRHFPLFVYDSKRDVFVGNPGIEAYRQGVRRTIRLQVELRCLGPIGQVRVENVELVTLDDLRGWILTVVMSLIVLVPLIPLLDTVEEARFPHHEELLLTLQGHVLVRPSRILRRHKVCELLLVSVHSLLLGVLEHLDRRIVEAIVVHDVESYPRVESSFLYFFSQAQLDEGLFDATLESFALFKLFLGLLVGEFLLNPFFVLLQE